MNSFAERTKGWERKAITVRVGWSGSKLHPAFVLVDPESGKEEMYGTACNCPGTRGGHKSLNVVAEGHESANCRGRNAGRIFNSRR